MDIVDRATRSRMMAGIRSSDTGPERVVRRHLHRAGLRFRLHVSLPGKPDIVLPKFRTALFVHGCFWHRHSGCKFSTTPATNKHFWQEKFAANIDRDTAVKRKLRSLGWRVHVIWTCQLDDKKLDSLVAKIRNPRRREV